MKKKILLNSLTALLLIGLAASTQYCKKSDSNQNTNTLQGSISLTYAGNTITFDSAYSTLPARGNDLKRILGKNRNAVVDIVQGTGTFCYFDIDNLAVGSHTHGSNRQFDYGVTFVYNDVYTSDGITEYRYTITSNTGNKISGSFAFRYNVNNPLDSVRGTFKDILIQ